MSDPFSSPDVPGCPPCKDGDHFGCWIEEAPIGFRSDEYSGPPPRCECEERGHP